MYKTLRLSFSLKNTYRVNSILFGIKQIPLIKKILPDALYSVRGLKIFANILSVIWEIVSMFLGETIIFRHYDMRDWNSVQKCAGGPGVSPHPALADYYRCLYEYRYV